MKNPKGPTGHLLSFKQGLKTQSLTTSRQGSRYLFNSVFLRFLKVDGGDTEFRRSYPLQSSSQLSVRTLWLQVKVDHQQAPLASGRSHWCSRGTCWTQTQSPYYAFHSKASGKIRGKLRLKILGKWLTLNSFWLSFKNLLFFYQFTLGENNSIRLVMFRKNKL